VQIAQHHTLPLNPTARTRQGWQARAFSCGVGMEERIELKDPEHPEAKAAAEATARSLMEVHRKRQEPQLARISRW
jgi:hypothetical protein